MIFGIRVLMLAFPAHNMRDTRLVSSVLLVALLSAVRGIDEPRVSMYKSSEERLGCHEYMLGRFTIVS